ncbi:MAG TPA: ATP-binding protein [Thermoanaerobaculia bacterium]|nr:ATP-binding protein [Thermoanaerobaculia bacterium]
MTTTDKVKILLVDDQPANLLALEAMLEGLDVLMIRADSGIKALKALLDHEVAVILLDVQMPVIDGFETAHLIRDREKSRYTPIIFVTALSRSDQNVFRGYSLGAVDYLFKPVEPEILRSKVSVFVDLFKKNLEIKQQTTELVRLSKQNELILNSAAEGVLGVDRNGRATFANPAAVTMMLWSADDLIGRDIHGLVHPPGTRTNCRPESCPVYQALCGGVTLQLTEDQFWRADGTSFPVEFSATMLRDEEGENQGAVFTFRDVTERRAAARTSESERLYREAQAANKAKDDFLATLSHELRTPMTAILGWLQMLRLDDIDATTFSEGLDTIESNAKHQAHLIEDMLDVSRIVMGKFRVERQMTRVPAVILSAVETVRHLADAKGVTLNTSIEEQASPMLADANRLKQVVWNLLSNSIKFTESGGTVEVEMRTVGDSIRIRVRDTGAGIDHEFLPHVFERLYQADTGKVQGGLGLGLAIVRHIVQLHGGTIEADSEGQGKGSTFTVMLPLAWSPGEEGGEEREAEMKDAPANALA